MSTEIIKILDDLGRRFGVAIDWSNKNIIPYLEELLSRFIQWEISTSIVWGVVGILLCAFGVIGAIGIWKKRDTYDFFGDIDEGCTWAFYISIVVAVIGVSVLLAQCFDICKAVYLPELKIYEYIKGEITNG